MSTGSWRLRSRCLGGFLCLALAGAVLAAVGGPAAAQGDADSVRSGALDLGDVTDRGMFEAVGGDGMVDGVGDVVDYFGFTITEDRRIGVRLSNQNRNADVFVEDSSGNVLAASREIGKQRDMLNVVLSAGGYFVRVEAQRRGSNSYRLWLGSAQPDPATAGFDTSVSVAVDGQTEGETDPHWDLDWVRMDLEECQGYVLEAKGRSSGSGTLMDPEIKGVYIDPSDSAMVDLYSLAGRLGRSGMMTSGMVDFSYDTDSGTGMDARLAYLAQATGPHWLVVESQGGWAGTYTIAVSTGDAQPSCNPQPQESSDQGTDDPAVTASFEQDSYSVAEGDTVTIKVVLSADPERSVTVPILAANQGGATAGDYSVPAQVVFASGDTEKTLSFQAVDDSVDDDGESVQLSLGTLPTGVTEGTHDSAVVSIVDGDVPQVTASFEQDSYSVAEGDTVTIKVVLSADPERTVTIPILTADQNGATSGDYSVPAQVVFASGDTEKTLSFQAVDDSVDDDGESVQLSLGTLPTGVTEGTHDSAVVSIV
ncbi:MAG: pre-peptidase C-terminal domain-containing protein, partial [bacterium]|nr:pre-peptidase C-terminal domain-containing protein [bacterium]